MRCPACDCEMSSADEKRKFKSGRKVDLCFGCYDSIRYMAEADAPPEDNVDVVPNDRTPTLVEMEPEYDEADPDEG